MARTSFTLMGKMKREPEMKTKKKQARLISLQVNSEKSLNWAGYDSLMEEKSSSWGV